MEKTDKINPNPFDNLIQLANNKTKLIDQFHADLDKLEWPKVLYVKDGKTFQDLVVALSVDVDWHFQPEDEGYAFFLIGPTMVKVDNQGQPHHQRLISFADGFAKTALEKEKHFVDELEKNESLQPEVKQKIKEMIEDGDLRVEAVTVNAGD